jgi:hypothetical protein
VSSINAVPAWKVGYFNNAPKMRHLFSGLIRGCKYGWRICARNTSAASAPFLPRCSRKIAVSPIPRFDIAARRAPLPGNPFSYRNK